MSITGAYRAGDSNGVRAGWRITFDYDEELIERIKTIPASQREWNPDGRFWWVAVEHEQELCTLLPGFELYLHQGTMF